MALVITELMLPLAAAQEEAPVLRTLAAKALGVGAGEIRTLRVVRESLDARKKNDIRFNCTVETELEPKLEAAILNKSYPRISKAERIAPRLLTFGTEKLERPVVVVGMGPAGLFAAYELAQHGYHPVVIERGKPIEQRAADVARLWESGTLDPDSNPMFGEGGAGTFSDGKLTTRIKDPRSAAVLDILAENGAPERIRILAKPHIGTDHLRLTVSNLRKRIVELGGEVRFGSKLSGILSEDGEIRAVAVHRNGAEESIPCAACVLAIGQGARDTYELLDGIGLELAPKAFAVGVRIEHPRELIDRAQFGAFAGNPRLGAAEYHLAGKSGARGVYTFCMCPGGVVVATPSAPGQAVTNGMSDYARDAENSNAAVVVQVGPEDFGRAPLDGMRFQAKLERRAYELGGGGFVAPAQRAADFLARRATVRFGGVHPTYRPGVQPAALDACLPDFVAQGVRDGIRDFGRKLKGFDMGDAVLTAVESRTSAPVRILRDENGEATRMRGLYPVGEGAGYAGGIVSAAVDGMHAAERIMARYCPQ